MYENDIMKNVDIYNGYENRKIGDLSEIGG